MISVVDQTDHGSTPLTYCAGGEHCLSAFGIACLPHIKYGEQIRRTEKVGRLTRLEVF